MTRLIHRYSTGIKVKLILPPSLQPRPGLANTNAPREIASKLVMNLYWWGMAKCRWRCTILGTLAIEKRFERYASRSHSDGTQHNSERYGALGRADRHAPC